ncbi:MAG: serine/threonine protein phosphatase [Spirochaetaceae bacterium]|jgi:hypothetical protein|nr:serine/threonine protein phosphatase [Spirochaetaceae bacterium]
MKNNFTPNGGVFFQTLLKTHFNEKNVLDMRPIPFSKDGATPPRPAQKVLILSDLHMGDGGYGDDLSHNGPMLTTLLREKYLAEGWNLVLNGDVEDVQRYRLSKIKRAWKELYGVFDGFAEKNMLYKTIGNHDGSLIFEKDYPYPLAIAIKIETAYNPIYVYHGHQASPVYTRFDPLLHFFIRYFLRPLGIPTMNISRNPGKRFFIEKEAYDFSIKNGCISIIAHTHRPLFKSLGRFEYIKYEIETHCRNYQNAQGEERERIRKAVALLRSDLKKLSASEKRGALRGSLYGDDLPVPCLFNSGCAISKKGVNAIELDGQNIALVYWFAPGAARAFVKRGGYKIEELPGGGFYKAVLNKDSLAYIASRIELLKFPPA